MIESAVIYAALGAGIAQAANIFVQLIKNRGATDAARVSAHAKLEEHWTDTTIELVDALRSELITARTEIGELRPKLAQLAHFEEALDHIYALLAALRSESAIELGAAVRRAQAFLSRMRGDDARGNLRQAAQTVISAQRIVEDVTGAPASKPKD